MKRAIIITIVLALAAVTVWAALSHSDTDPASYRLTAVERGDLEATVSATGSLDAVTTVQVGTQVSGIIDTIDVDYNDLVTAGQVIARIDTTLLSNAVDAARANLARSEAELRQARREAKRIDALHAEQLVSAAEQDEATSSVEIAAAAVQSAEVDLARAEQNLNYATITSPIDGVVIDRAVDEGQTVAASLSAPELFLIAEDLTHMQILASVDESDIGQIRPDQAVRFTVQAYADDEFTGTVRQVRLDAASTENVVNYTVVVDVENPDGRLLPGMTATVDFLVETAADVLYVSNAALRYKPDTETMQAVMGRRRAAAESEGRTGPPALPEGVDRSQMSMLWTIDDTGQLAMIPVITGLSDGTHTAITGRDLAEGTQIVAGRSSSAAASTSSSPFRQQSDNQRRPGPPAPGGF